MYSATELARYHTGEMSEREMHALEKAALDDPFLADALEGFDNSSTAEVTAEMDFLKERLAKRIEGKKRRLAFPFYRVGIAAAVFLLAGTLSLIYFLNKSEEQERQVIVQQTPSIKQDQAPVQDTDSLIPVPQMQAKKDPQPIKKELAKERESFQANREVPKEPKPLSVASAPSAMASRQAPDTLHIPERNTAMAKMKKIEDQADLKKSDTAALEEAVVVGYGSQKKLDVTGSVTDARSMVAPRVSISPYGIDADKAAFSPIKGWTDFTAYFQKSMSQKTEWQNKHGEIILAFRIDESGAAKDIHVEKSPDPAINQEAIRIINAGPKWTISAGAERLVKISINF